MEEIEASSKMQDSTNAVFHNGTSIISIVSNCMRSLDNLKTLLSSTCVKTECSRNVGTVSKEMVDRNGSSILV